MANYQERILYGFSGIHVAKLGEEGVYETPVELLGAKSVEVSITTNNKSVYADNKSVHTFILASSGEGTLTMLGLTAEERRMLAGLDDLQAGFGINDNPNKPVFAMTFEQDCVDGSKMMYVVYNCQFDLSGISLTTTEEEIEEQNLEIPFVVNKGENGYFYYAVNTNEAEASTSVAQWHTAIQQPIVGA